MTRFVPALTEFQDWASQFDLVPVYRRLLSDALTPVTAFQLLVGSGEPDPRAPILGADGSIKGSVSTPTPFRNSESSGCLFESVIGGEKVGRYSIIAVNPRLRISATGKMVTVEQVTTQQVTGERGKSIETRECDDPLDYLRQLIGNRSVAPIPELPPFIGGAVGYAGYDVVRYVEELPNAPPNDRNLPDMDFGFYDDLVVFDNVTKTMLVIALVAPKKFSSPEMAYVNAQCRINAIVDRLANPPPSSKPADIQLGGFPDVQSTSNFTQRDYETAVQKCNEYIRAGDIFQVVISQRLEVECDCDPFEIYRSLRVINPSPFMFFLRTPAVVLVGSSPEVMCRVVDSVVTVRPLAGTRPRGRTQEEDVRLAQELLADPKERAEHVMLVDLGRNDIGRVAKFGSVQLSELMVVERYSHVMHISSNVDGILRDDCDAMDALKACLPAGTVSGAPKVRAMQIIDEIEPTRRGPYAGAVGYFDYRGNMDTCIALRTMVICNGKIYIQAGAGLVADSDPAAEYQETLNKARAMLRAIEATRNRLAE